MSCQPFYTILKCHCLNLSANKTTHTKQKSALLGKIKHAPKPKLHASHVHVQTEAKIIKHENTTNSHTYNRQQLLSQIQPIMYRVVSLPR